MNIRSNLKLLVAGLLAVIACGLIVVIAYFQIFSPRAQLEGDIKNNVMQSDILSKASLLYARDSSVGLHYSQLEGSFQTTEQQSQLLLEQDPFKSCEGTCESTAWRKLDIDADKIVYPIAEVSSLVDQSMVYCANQTIKNSKGANTSRDICLDKKTWRVWYTVYFP